MDRIELEKWEEIKSTLDCLVARYKQSFYDIKDYLESFDGIDKLIDVNTINKAEGTLYEFEMVIKHLIQVTQEF